jgi:hypothetical protein
MAAFRNQYRQAFRNLGSPLSVSDGIACFSHFQPSCVLRPNVPTIPLHYRRLSLLQPGRCPQLDERLGLRAAYRSAGAPDMINLRIHFPAGTFHAMRYGPDRNIFRSIFRDISRGPRNLAVRYGGWRPRPLPRSLVIC